MKRKKPRNNRRLEKYSYEPARQRLLYLCDLIFVGDGREMAFAVGLDYRDLNAVFRGDTKVTVRLLAHVATRLNVRAEWLLCGTGTICCTANNALAENNESAGLQLPAAIQSSFSVFDPVAEGVSSTLSLPAKRTVKNKQPQDLKPYLRAGRAVYQARVNNKLIGFFLGHDCFTVAAAASVLPFFKAGFGHVLCTTLSAACFDISSACALSAVDINGLAAFAANRGIGYGEAIGLSALDSICSRDASVLATVSDLGLPIVVSAELGEIAAHTAPAVRGAEAGAAIGAAAYVDLLVLTEQLKAFFGQPGGVFIVAGERLRGVRLILQRIESLRALIPKPAGFTFVVFSRRDRFIESFIHKHGGHVIFLDYPTTAAFTQLFQTCTDVYAGKISHDHK